MDFEYVVGKTFNDLNNINEPFPKAEYENCNFVSCDLANADLSGAVFQDCKFRDCNISLAKLKNTALRDVVFTGCKMLGLQWGDCSQFGFSIKLHNCVVDSSSFYKVRLKNAQFINTRLLEVDFTEADLTGVVFDGCDLTGATFDNTNLEGADLRTATGYSIDPENNRIAKAKFSLAGVGGLLNKYDIELEH